MGRYAPHYFRTATVDPGATPKGNGEGNGEGNGKGEGKGKGKGKGEEGAGGGKGKDGGKGKTNGGRGEPRPAKGQRAIIYRPDKWKKLTPRGDLSHALRLARQGGVEVKSRSGMPAVQELGPMLKLFKKRVQPRPKDYNGQGFARPTVFIDFNASFMREFKTGAQTRMRARRPAPCPPAYATR